MGTMTVSAIRMDGVTKIKADWVSGSSGGASATTPRVVGKVVSAVAMPGTTGPTNNYTVKVTDEDGVDILNGQLVGNCSSTGPTMKTQSDTLGYAIGILTIGVTGAGVTGNGSTIIILEG